MTGQTSAAEALARAETEALCMRLRERGDAVSMEAAAMLEGTLMAFANLVEDLASLRARAALTQANFDRLSLLWGRVPPDVRHKAAHAR